MAGLFLAIVVRKPFSAAVNQLQRRQQGLSWRRQQRQFQINGYDLELQFNNGTRATTRIVAPTQDIEMLLIGETVFIKKSAR